MLHVYGIEGSPAPVQESGLDGIAGVIDDDGWSYLVFTEPADELLERAGLEPRYQAALPYEGWLDGDLSAPVREAGLVIVPPWCEPAPGGERRLEGRRLRLEPGLAFGTGAHPTTRRCLRVMASLLEGPAPPRTVLDLGCGTGVLSLAALALGARRARGCDLSRHAVDLARRNAARNELSDRATFLHRSAETLIEPADLVLANLPPAALDLILAHPSLRSSRRTLVSGMLADQADRLDRELPPPLEIIETWTDGFWRTILIGGAE